MSGIVVCRSPEQSISESTLKRALETLSHRNLDCQKIWLSDDRKVGLGHTKLSILDDLSGDQPIANTRGTQYIVSNGDFYGLEGVREDLKQQGYSFKTQANAEVLLHLYD